MNPFRTNAVPEPEPLPIVRHGEWMNDAGTVKLRWARASGCVELGIYNPQTYCIEWRKLVTATAETLSEVLAIAIQESKVK